MLLSDLEHCDSLQLSVQCRGGNLSLDRDSGKNRSRYNHSLSRTKISTLSTIDSSFTTLFVSSLDDDDDDDEEEAPAEEDKEQE